jgi:transcriptional regulator with XRE-family HTH domain
MSQGHTTVDLSARLQAVRKRRGLSQRELANLAGVSASLVRKIEQGVVQDTRLETVRRLASALRVPTTQLLERPHSDDQPVTTEIWEPTKRALIGLMEQPGEPPTVEGVRRAILVLRSLHNGTRRAITHCRHSMG